MSSAAALAEAAPWWWTHASIIEAADPLDPTADDAAATCLASVVAATARHVESHAAPLLLSLRCSDAGAAPSAPATRFGWEPVLIPLLGQLRRAMARAQEERAEEGAEAAAESDSLHPSQSAAPTTTAAAAALAQESVAAAACADATLLRRLRVLQQQIYLAFLKAVVQGISAGLHTAAAHGGGEAAARADHVAAVLLDSVLVSMAEAATTASPAVGVGAAGEERRKRRGHGGISSSSSASAIGAAATTAADWFAGMMPLYMRAALYAAHTQERDTDKSSSDAGSGDRSRRSVPSPALCLVSYLGMFVQDGGLQLLPSEQAAHLPLFTQHVRRALLTQLSQLTNHTVREAAAIVSGQAADAHAAVSVATAHVNAASEFARRLGDAQLYSDSDGGELDASDGTAAFAFHTTLASALRGQSHADPAALTEAAVDYTVVALVPLTTYETTAQVFAQLDAWWTACRRLLTHAQSTVKAVKAEAEAVPSARAGDAKEADVAQLAALDSLVQRMAESWQVLRTHALRLTAVLGLYADTSLLLLPYGASLTRLFYAAPATAEQRVADTAAALPLDAWKAYVRDVHRSSASLLQSSKTPHSHSGATTTATATTAAAAAAASASGSLSSSRPLRAHYRNTGGMSFAAASFARLNTAVSDAAFRAATEVDTNTLAARSQDVSVKTLPIAFALLHQPLMALQERVLSLLVLRDGVGSSLRVDVAVGEKGSVADRSLKAAAAATAALNTATEDGASLCSPALASSARARALAAQPLTASAVVELCFPRHYRLLRAMDQAMQYCLLRSQELSAGMTGDDTAAAAAWVSASGLPATLSSFVGAALDEAFVVHMKTGIDEVCCSELLMFYAAVFRTLPPAALPCLRGAISTFLGSDGERLVAYLRHHIVDQQRYGLVAFFLPPLRAMGLDHSTVEDTTASLALAAKPVYASAMAYAWELPRLFFFRHSDTPAAEVAWRAASAAQAYVWEALLSPHDARAAFMAIVQEAAEVAQLRLGRGVADAKNTAATAVAAALGATDVAATDAMMAFHLATCRWCATELAAPVAPASREVFAELLTSIGAGRKEPSTVPHPYLSTLQHRLQQAFDGGAANAAAAATPASRVASWLWSSTYDEVNPAHLQLCAKRLLRDFTVQFSQHAPIKTILGVRATVEQKMKAEEAADAAAALRRLTVALEADMQDLLQETDATHKMANEESVVKKTSTAAAAQVAANTEEKAETPAPPTASGAAATAAVVSAAVLRRYLDQLVQALVARARLSVVDGAVSAACLLHLLRALSHAGLAIQLSPQDRQRMCERFVFALTSSVLEQTQVETLSAACSLRLVLDTIVVPYKKSFLEGKASLRAFHGCLSDSEADAFKMMQHTTQDILAALHKCLASTSRTQLQRVWKAVVLLEQLGDVLSLIRSAVEKIVSAANAMTDGRIGLAMERMRRQVLLLQREAARTDRGAAVDVFHLFTHHPAPPPAAPSIRPSAATGSGAAATTTKTAAVPTAASQGNGTPSSQPPKRTLSQRKRESKKRSKMRRALEEEQHGAPEAHGGASDHRHRRAGDTADGQRGEKRPAEESRRGDRKRERSGDRDSNAGGNGQRDSGPKRGRSGRRGGGRRNGGSRR